MFLIHICRVHRIISIEYIRTLKSMGGLFLSLQSFAKPFIKNHRALCDDLNKFTSYTYTRIQLVVLHSFAAVFQLFTARQFTKSLFLGCTSTRTPSSVRNLLYSWKTLTTRSFVLDLNSWTTCLSLLLRDKLFNFTFIWHSSNTRPLERVLLTF